MKACKRIFTIVLILTLSSPFSKCQEAGPIGLFVYNFTRLLDWPESAKTGDFVIQVLGHKSVYDELTRLTQEKKVGFQTIMVQSISSPDQINTHAQIIFVGHWQSKYLKDILNKVGTNPCLIVTEMEGLLDQGSAVNFIIRDNKMVFEVKTSNIDKHQIKTDRRLRELAYRVID